ncbi:MAG TPA: hypothetical protein VMB47_10700 [Candidatus Aquilonibacter sp.]|nr:hypothetical protein [Candidatus Aquilonibacter sp.]
MPSGEFWKYLMSLAIIFATSALAAASCAAQTNRTPAAPVPAAIASSRRIFISNAGDSCVVARKLGQGPDVAYNEFYADMKAWGHYDLAASPEASDLVFEIRFECPLFATQTSLDTYDPRFQLRIIDPKVNIVLWTITEHIEGAFRISTAEKNFAAGEAAIVTDLKTIAGSNSDSSVPSSQ